MSNPDNTPKEIREIPEHIKEAFTDDWKKSRFFNGHISNGYVVYESAYLSGYSLSQAELKEKEAEIRILRQAGEKLIKDLENIRASILKPNSNG